MSEDDADELRRDLKEEVSDSLDDYIVIAASKISAYLEKTLDGIVSETAYCNEITKRRVQDILTEEIYLPLIMNNNPEIHRK